MTFEQAEKELDDATKALAEARKREREASADVRKATIRWAEANTAFQTESRKRSS